MTLAVAGVAFLVGSSGERGQWIALSAARGSRPARRAETA
jgi:hypothetical protein